jgi:MOSC domain-containing protein YiiM
LLDEALTLADLHARHAGDGRVTWIGIRPGRRLAMTALAEAQADPESGLSGDRYAKAGKRQVTLLQAEHLAVIGRLLGRADGPDPALLRRNLVVAGINLLALKGARFRVGEAVLEGTGACHPCSRMEEALGPGGYNAVRGHGGITARVLEPGGMALGDPVILV